MYITLIGYLRDTSLIGRFHLLDVGYLEQIHLSAIKYYTCLKKDNTIHDFQNASAAQSKYLNASYSTQL